MVTILEDDVKTLFDGLPNMKEYDDELVSRVVRGKTPDMLKGHLLRFVANHSNRLDGGPRTSHNSDEAYILEKVTRLVHDLDDPNVFIRGCDILFLAILGDIALRCGRNINDLTDTSMKSHWTRYALWVIRGRRDGEIPFSTGEGTAACPSQVKSSPSREYYATLNAATARATQRCDHCGKSEGKLLRCTRCLVDEDWAYLAVAYCSKECQVAGWKKHKSICLPRQLLSRAVSVVQLLSRQFEQRTFNLGYDIISVREDAIRLKVIAGMPWDDPSLTPEAFKGGFIFRPPPCQVLGADSEASRDYDEAVLRHSKCTQQSTVEWPYIELFIEGLCNSINVLPVFPKNASIVVSDVVSAGTLNGAIVKHGVLNLRTDSGEAFVLDLSSPQYGWRETLSPTRDYVATRVAKADVEQPRVAHAGKLERLRAINMGDHVVTAGYKLKAEVAQVVLFTIRNFLHSEGFLGQKGVVNSMWRVLIKGSDSAKQEPGANVQLAVRAMLKLDKAAFESCRSRILSLTDVAISDVVNQYASRGLYCLCLDSGLNLRVTDDEYWANVYRGLWLTQEEWEPIRDKPEELLERWNRRLAQVSSGKLIKSAIFKSGQSPWKPNRVKKQDKDSTYGLRCNG
ncbi:hypothetical protein VPNG_02607 [Cytospora leucostoma]|uniref:MYND-type domain-containing protein n=1 Tax=Cytospora leucostoma TaxID=1230097 RepID=A0A423XI41_9PEZI|nr:hypothetical protein VPNG_02607 [Cytospora leucostoma]